MFFYTFLPKLWNMSLTASVVIIFVLLLRLLLLKSPKVISYALWSPVLFRLLCPVSIESGFSLFSLLGTPVAEYGTITNRIAYIPIDLVHTENPSITLPVPAIGELINQSLPQGVEQLVADPLEAPMAILTYVWVVGVMVMAIYTIVSFLNLHKKLLIVSRLRDNIYLADEITSPFVMGLFQPKIYLPSSLSKQEHPYIILHEQHHIRRWDHIIKALAYVALCIHWFNPLVWIAFTTASKDMEMSCDEAVVKKMGDGVLADYTASLLSLATGKHFVAGIPLAFGESDTKERIHNLANWKKPTVWVILLGTVVCIVTAICLLTNPKYTLTAEDALLQLENNVVYEGNTISFTIPAYDEGKWNIYISGRAVYEDGFSRSLHYLEEETWSANTSYTFQPDSAAVELTLDVFLHSQTEGTLERTIDLLSKKTA